MNYALTLLVLLLMQEVGSAQYINEHVIEANSLYKQKKFDKALPKYQKSIAEGATDPVTKYNLANAYFRNGKFDESVKEFSMIAEKAQDQNLKQRANFNQGVSYTKQKKLEESIKSYKLAVILDPGDEDARFNLQKALLELKKKQPQEPQQKEDEKKKQEKNNNQKKQPKSNLTKKQVEQLLKALQQREQQVQEKMQQNRNRSAGQQEKDW